MHCKVCSSKFGILRDWKRKKNPWGCQLVICSCQHSISKQKVSELKACRLLELWERMPGCYFCFSPGVMWSWIAQLSWSQMDYPNHGNPRLSARSSLSLLGRLWMEGPCPQCPTTCLCPASTGRASTLVEAPPWIRLAVAKNPVWKQQVRANLHFRYCWEHTVEAALWAGLLYKAETVCVSEIETALKFRCKEKIII